VSLFLLLVVLPLALQSVPPQLHGNADRQAWFWLYGSNWLFAREGGFSQTSGGYFWSLAVEEAVLHRVAPGGLRPGRPQPAARQPCASRFFPLLSRIVLVNLGVSTGAPVYDDFHPCDGLAVGSCLAVCAPLAAADRACNALAAGRRAAGGDRSGAVRIADGDAFFWSRQMATFGYTFAAVLFGALLVWILAGRKTLGSPASSPRISMRQCGKYSYALYVVHVPAASVVFPVARSAARAIRARDRLRGRVPRLRGAVVHCFLDALQFSAGTCSRSASSP